MCRQRCAEAPCQTRDRQVHKTYQWYRHVRPVYKSDGGSDRSRFLTVLRRGKLFYRIGAESQLCGSRNPVKIYRVPRFYRAILTPFSSYRSSVPSALLIFLSYFSRLLRALLILSLYFIFLRLSIVWNFYRLARREFRAEWSTKTRGSTTGFRIYWEFFFSLSNDRPLLALTPPCAFRMGDPLIKLSPSPMHHSK